MSVENPITLAVEAAPDDWTTTNVFVLAYLFERGDVTRPEVEDKLGLSHPPARRALKGAVRAGLARETDGPDTGERGPNPSLFVATPPGDETVDLDQRQLKDRIVEELAHLHYRRGISSANNKRLRLELPDSVTPQAVATCLRQLDEAGIVERLDSNRRYRLTGAGEVAPFRQAVDA